jgi:hypothetical protein
MRDMYKTAVNAALNRNPPVVHIEVPQAAMKQLEDLSAGNEVHVLLIGKLTEKSERKPTLEIPGMISSVTVEVRRMAICRDENSMADLMDD